MIRCGAALVALGAALTVAGCGDGGAHARGAPRRGGTVYLLAESNGLSHLDPQRAYTTAALNVMRLVYRTLTAFRPAPGHPDGVLTPDLATDLGRPSDSNRTWDFTLRRGLRWQDGRPVTCAQVRYGVERSFAAGTSGGPSFPRDLLAATAGYAGPGGGHLDSVRCLSRRTIRFRLARPCGDFADVVAMPVFAPSRPDLVRRGGYDRAPASDGPYRIAEHTHRRLVLTRNRYWRRDTDPVRPALPDRYVVRFGVDAAVATDRIIRGAGTARAAIELDFNVPPEFLQQVINDPVLDRRTVAGPTGAVRYLAINTRTVPDVRCRRALAYATDKEQYRMLVGGATVGDYATTMIPPGMPGHGHFDLYGTHRSPSGDLARATRLAQSARCPSRLTLDFQDVASIRRAADAIVDSYQRIGVRVVRHPIPKPDYYDRIGVPAQQHDLVLAAWVPDWPSGSAIMPALFDGRRLATHAHGGNFDFSLLADPTVDTMIDRARSARGPASQAALWIRVDRAVARRAATVPILYERGLALHGAAVRGARMQSLYGEPDVLSLGLSAR